MTTCSCVVCRLSLGKSSLLLDLMSVSVLVSPSMCLDDTLGLGRCVSTRLGKNC